MQGLLLVMCLFWKVRQRRLGVDDFGNPLPDAPSGSHFQHHTPSDSSPSHLHHRSSPEEPLYAAETVGAGTEQGEVGQQEAVTDAVRDAMETTPLLPPTPAPKPKDSGKKGFFGLLGR